MIELPLNLLRIQVTFNPDNIGSLDPEENPLFTFSGDIEGTNIPIPSGIAMIVFNLDTAPTTILPAPAPAVFQTSPIQWFETAEGGSSTNNPTLLPGMFMFQRIGDTTVTLLDFNSNQSEELVNTNHWFHIVVVYNTFTYGSDPTIINQPPGG